MSFYTYLLYGPPSSIYMTLNISCTDGTVLALFYGQSAGQHVDWSFLDLYQSRDDLIKSLKSNLDSNESYFDI